MIQTTITNREDWKLRFHIKDCEHPEGLKHLVFTGEQYNDKGELTNSSTYDFFLDKSEIKILRATLTNGIE